MVHGEGSRVARVGKVAADIQIIAIDGQRAHGAAACAHAFVIVYVKESLPQGGPGFAVPAGQTVNRHEVPVRRALELAPDNEVLTQGGDRSHSAAAGLEPGVVIGAVTETTPE